MEGAAAMEGEGELIPLSKFKLQLLSLLNESRHIREREGGVREELDNSNEKSKRIEAESDKQVGELRAELDSRRDFQKKLELRVKYLENENGLLEKKEKDLKDAINGLLQSRESFIRHYEDSNCSLQRTIQMKDKEISLLSEKLNTHISLFNSVEKEANLVKRALDGVKRSMNEKEQVVAGLNEKVGRVFTLEKDFVEKINSLETKLTDCKLEIRRKNIQISELQEKIESEKISNDSKSQIEEISFCKDETIERLSSEKQSMREELHYMEVIIQRFQEIFSKLKTEDKQMVSPVQQEVNMEQNNSLENKVEQIQQNLNNKEINMDMNNEEIIRDGNDQNDKTGADDNQQLEKDSSENHKGWLTVARDWGRRSGWLAAGAGVVGGSGVAQREEKRQRAGRQREPIRKVSFSNTDLRSGERRGGGGGSTATATGRPVKERRREERQSEGEKKEEEKEKNGKKRKEKGRKEKKEWRCADWAIKKSIYLPRQHATQSVNG
ncbi:hypothetical protein LUZ60_002558 [Juncus effusus]|nr:hypothetical protein LUZ60_002558 [Juncus effusus]